MKNKNIKFLLVIVLIISFLSIKIDKNLFSVENEKYKASNDIELRSETGFKIESGYLKGIEANRQASGLDLGLDIEYTIKVKDKNNIYKLNEIIFTGDTVEIYLNNVKKYEYTVVINGDISGDGKVNSADLLLIRKHLLRIQDKQLSGEYFASADMNSDNKINSLDLLRVRKYLLNQGNTTGKYQITYNNNSGTGSMSVQEVKKYDTTNLIRNTFTKEGYTFASWNTKANGSGTTYKDVEKVSLENNTTLYAQWRKNTLSIKYNGNGGIWNENSISSYNKLYIDNQQDGFVRLRSNNEIFVSEFGFNEQNVNLLDYNGGYLNWIKNNAGVPPESEYYIVNENTNKKIYLNQEKKYSSAYLANIAGCNILENGCSIVVYVNWEEYQITDSDYLKTSGTKFVKTSNNNGVVLRGFNLGEWLSRAISLSPMENAYKSFNTSDFPSPYTNLSSAYWREYADNDVQINYVLYKRFGKEGEYELNNIYFKNFITESDIDKMEQIGINLVRVPLAWSYFVDFTYIEPAIPIIISSSTKPIEMNAYKYNYTMLPEDKLNDRLKRLDWIVHECRKRGIYVIFDLHVVDGGQSDYGIRPARGFTFYEDQNAQNNAINIWKIISKRFKGNPGVAGYELLNEPSAGIGPTGNKYMDRPVDSNMYRDELIRFYDMAYKEIRDIDPNHIILMEAPYPGYPRVHQIYMEDSNGNPLLTLPTETQRMNGINDESICPATNCKWTNVAYSLHDYFKSTNVSDRKEEIVQKVSADVSDMKKYNVPIYIGETNFTYTSSDDEELSAEYLNELWPYALTQYDNNLFSYTIWTYKVAKSTKYGMVYNLKWNRKTQSMGLLLSDSYNTIANKWSMTAEEANYDYSTKYINILKNNFINKSNKPLIGSQNYSCSAGETKTASIKIFSRDGSVTIDNVTTNDSSVAEVSFVNSTGVVCTSSSCKTINIKCKKSGSTRLTVTASNGSTATSTITVSNN